MIFARPCAAFTLSCVLALAAVAGPPTLIVPENNASDQPADVILTWEAGALTNYVQNGSFEQFSAGWDASSGWAVSSSSVDEPAAAGSRFVTVTADGRSGGETYLVQTVKLPRLIGSARLSWSDSTYGTTIGPGGPLDSTMRWQVYTSDDGSAPVYDRVAGENDGAGWQPHDVDVSSLKGKSFTLAFVMEVGIPSSRGGAILDDVRIEIIPQKVEYEIYLGPKANLGAAQLLGMTADSSWNLSNLASGSTNYWKINQITDGVRVSSPVFQFVVGGSVPVEAPPLLAELSGGQLHLHALTQPGGFYLFEQADAPDSNAWQPIGDEIVGDGAEAAADVPLDVAARFFRIRVTR